MSFALLSATARSSAPTPLIRYRIEYIFGLWQDGLVGRSLKHDSRPEAAHFDLDFHRFTQEFRFGPVGPANSFAAQLTPSTLV